MLTPPIAPAATPSALTTYQGVIERLASLGDAEFADVDPHALEPIPVPVRVSARVVTGLEHPALGSSDDGSCIAGTAAPGQGGTVPLDRAP